MLQHSLLDVGGGVDDVLKGLGDGLVVWQLHPQLLETLRVQVRTGSQFHSALDAGLQGASKVEAVEAAEGLQGVVNCGLLGLLEEVGGLVVGGRAEEVVGDEVLLLLFGLFQQEASGRTAEA